MMDFDRFMYTQSKSGSDGIQSGKYRILIEIQVRVLVQLPVLILVIVARVTLSVVFEYYSRMHKL